MDDESRGLPTEWLPQLRRTRAALTVSDEVGLALRDHRRRLGVASGPTPASAGSAGRCWPGSRPAPAG